ncbi:MAG: aldehyde dehydrogenase family protein [Myxococcales bacterium]|nr:aldehyde dehydrogenase family protein [Myxococcales bacterium]MCB9642968.1 aldehyde dehydrogenase family protein [Myxococcales bacterium]
MDTQRMDHDLKVLEENKTRWARLPIREKIQLLSKVRDGFVKIMHEQVEGGLRAKGIRRDTPQSADEWMGGPVIILRNLRLLQRSLEQVADAGRPYLDMSKVRTRSNGQVVVNVFPETVYDKILYSGFSAEIWMKPEVARDALTETMATFYHERDPEGEVALILGAGNVSSIAPLDAVYKLFVEGKVCALKFNPVNDYLGPSLEKAFEPLVKEGFLRFMYGGGDVGAYLCKHEVVKDIHITGSDKTHDMIVFGPGAEGEERKRKGERLLDKKITSELGNVSPVIVVPGVWSDAELQFHAENVATQMTQNSGFNCNAAKVLITHAAWDQREAFLNKLRDVLRGLAPRNAYYPGAQDRFKKFTEGVKQVDAFGELNDESVPFTLLPGLDWEDKGNLRFCEESFCSVTGEVPLPAANATDFLQKAVKWANETLHGTLNACVLIHPRTERQIGAKAFEEAIAELKYGSIGINHWPALSYGLGNTTWGAYPGHTYEDIQSGIGVVHNIMMFEQPEKSVIRGGFTVFPKPPWFVTHRLAHKVGERIAQFEYDPNPAKLPGIFWYAARG